MGEYSKRIGEIGEEIVTDFLELIGWLNPQRNFDIPSINSEKHGKQQHGIDAYFHYVSPMISKTLENVLISCKFSNAKYPNSPATKFKEYYWDLAIAIESFKKSQLRNNTLNQHQRLEGTFDRGVIFWLNNIQDDNYDLAAKLLNIEVAKGAVHNGIFLVDNRRIQFIYDAIKFAKFNYPGATIQFAYFNTGLNNDDTEKKNGNILPVQYITTSVLPLRVQEINLQTTLIIATIEKFEQAELIKLMGLAKNMGNNLQTNTVICFEDYNKLTHEQIVNNTLQIFNDSTFTATLSVVNYNSSFRG